MQKPFFLPWPLAFRHNFLRTKSDSLVFQAYADWRRHQDIQNDPGLLLEYGCQIMHTRLIRDQEGLEGIKTAYQVCLWLKILS